VASFLLPLQRFFRGQIFKDRFFSPTGLFLGRFRRILFGGEHVLLQLFYLLFFFTGDETSLLFPFCSSHLLTFLCGSAILYDFLFFFPFPPRRTGKDLLGGNGRGDAVLFLSSLSFPPPSLFFSLVTSYC